MILWTNATFYTLENENKTTTKLLTDEGVIIAVGEDTSNYSPDQIIDLQGGHIYPGFVDSHIHIIGYGVSKFLLNISHLHTKDEILSFVRTSFKDAPLYVEGYFATNITKDDLDNISMTYPIMLRHNDYHSFTVNSYVLQKLNVKHPSGILLEQEAILAKKIWVSVDEVSLTTSIQAATNSLLSYGITTILTEDLAYFNSYSETMRILKENAQSEKIRTHLLVHKDVLGSYLNDNVKQDPFFKVSAVKFFYDGTLSSKSALLKKNYAGLKTSGDRIMSVTDFETLLMQVRKAKMTVAVHTIGDLALEELITLLLKYPPRKGLKDRIIHASLVSSSDIEQLKTMPVVLDVQPQFISSDYPGIVKLFSHSPMVYPFKTFSDNNILYSFSSDAPVEIPNPLLGIYSATTRKAATTGEEFDTDEIISSFEALQRYTVYGAKSLGYKNKGLLKVGYLADFTIFSNNILEMDSAQLLKEKTIMTIVNEKIVYKR